MVGCTVLTKVKYGKSLILMYVWTVKVNLFTEKYWLSVVIAIL